jgi:cytochrome c oxidase subunit 2
MTMTGSTPARRQLASASAALFVCVIFVCVLSGRATPAGLARPAAPAAQAAPPLAAQVVEVSAERFAFAPSEVRARAGVPIEFHLTSDDTDHGFRILGTAVDVRIPKRGRGRATVTFTPAEPGRYTFECSHLCGAGHAFMRGTIHVTR